jgi:hypothetical protein
MEIKVRYDVPVEVTQTQYNHMMNNLTGIVCGRYDEVENKYYIKCWNMRYKKLVIDVLKKMK